MLDTAPVTYCGPEARESRRASLWSCARPARHRRDLAAGRQPLDRDRHRRAVGRQEPVLCVLPFPRDRHPFRPGAVLEPLSLRRASERRRPAIADLLAAVRAVGAVRSVAVDPRLRPHRLRAPAAGGLAVGALGWRAGWPAAASILAAVDLHVRRAGLRPAAAHRHHPELRPVPGGAALHADGAAAPLDRRSRARSAWWRRYWRSAATTRPCCCASSLAPRWSAEIVASRGQAALSARAPRRCWRRWASSRLLCWRCRCC